MGREYMKDIIIRKYGQGGIGRREVQHDMHKGSTGRKYMQEVGA